MPTIWNNTRKVIVSSTEVLEFNRRWPGSKLRPTRSYWFEFDQEGDLIDTDVPEQDDGPEAAALAEDCLAWLDGSPTPSGVWFALADDGEVYCLCDCGDFEAAEGSAKDLGINAVWIANEATARQWQARLNHNLKDK